LQSHSQMQETKRQEMQEKRERQVQRNQQAIELMDMLDKEAIDAHDRNDMKNAIGFVNHFFNLVDFQEEECVLGLLSPLARPTSAISTNFAGSSNQVPIFQLPETPLGKQYSFRQPPFQSFVELKESLSVTKRDSEYLNKAKGRLEPISADVSSIIMRNRSVGCCSLRNCPMTNSVITSSFVEFSMGQQNCIGACLLCQAHVQETDAKFSLPLGTHIYLLSDEWQKTLKKL